MAKNQNEIRISAKDLGAMALEDFCPRCFWIKRHVKPLPFQIFPGIFSSIDAYTKHVMHSIFDAHYSGSSPATTWINTNLPHIVNAERWLKIPHWSQFKRLDPASGITLSGVPDDFYEIDATIGPEHVMPDYKTAKFTETQDKLLPMYRIQQNGYKWIGADLGYNVVDMPLCYCEPISLDDIIQESQCDMRVISQIGFNMAFKVKTLEIATDEEWLLELMQKARDIIEMPAPPAGREGCKDCLGLDQIVFNLSKKCQGVEIEPGVYTGCDQSGGDCPACGK